ncbi:Acyl-CoA synthetase (AMP-forming)/AMP-acid ligase II [Marinactinospora thermotolerans DSM 45154]|uniref:Acyl-CoA synthetase (AMP-forming)/AMP-acid ligase II n=1 Tax=Marinactinospora thermotolerans DSM 45154 TaxID=1122192 RepID=A0A1T4QZY8_9ACTN|nr:fatty acyl-AMP ligase [Marinactinospora thermotolerans]SKA09205.1 Acyl-CoA synthetase (AMP-forming)/AMP-acid ligase II [Marinactinospora thermotolerans DSM 45154]
MPSSFTGHVLDVVERHGETRSYTFLRESSGGLVEDTLTYAGLDLRARELGALLSESPGAGSRALLLYPAGLGFLEAFLGCLYSGVVAVPIPLPTNRASLDRVAGVIADCSAEIVLTDSTCHDDVVERLAQSPPPGGPVPVVATDRLGAGRAGAWRMPALGPDSIAFLQYTSGSTSAPKGVMVTHANLLANEQSLLHITGLTDQGGMAGWLPHFHDMGLIGMLLNPLYAGADCAYLSPLGFMKHPFRWLEAITRLRATCTVAPDFAYGLTANRVTDEELERLDLSSLRSAINGAEPVRARTLRAFTRRFAPVGFRQEAFQPSYGLAEATLLVAGPSLEEEPVIKEFAPAGLEAGEARETAPGTGLALVACGRPVDLDVRIVDPQTHVELADTIVGEIWVRGGSVAAGYWNAPEKTARTFQATLVGENGAWLRTGDLGFYEDGRLFIAGRVDDMIIVNGRNFHPQDLEDAAQGVHPAFTAQPAAAFAVEAGSRTHIILVQEIRRGMARDTTIEELAERLRATLSSSFGLSRVGVCLVAGGVPRTTSGKVQRRRARALFLESRYRVFATALDDTVEALVRAQRSEDDGTARVPAEVR